MGSYFKLTIYQQLYYINIVPSLLILIIFSLREILWHLYRHVEQNLEVNGNIHIRICGSFLTTSVAPCCYYGVYIGGFGC